MFAIIKYRYDDNDERRYKLESDFVNLAIETELKKFFIPPYSYNDLAVDIENPLSDYSSDYDKAMDMVVPIVYMLPIYSNYKPVFSYDVPLKKGGAGSWEDFASRKFIQLCKLVKSNKFYEPDLFQTYLLFELSSIDICRHTPSIQSDCKKELLKLIKEEIYEDCNDEDDKAYAKDRYHCYAQAFRNLHYMVKEDHDNELDIITDNLDWSFVSEKGLVDAIRTLIYSGSPYYTEKDFTDMFTSVGYEVPEEVRSIFHGYKDLVKEDKSTKDTLDSMNIDYCDLEHIDEELSQKDLVLVDQFAFIIHGIKLDEIEMDGTRIFRFTSDSGKEYSAILATVYPIRYLVFPRSSEIGVFESIKSQIATNILKTVTGTIGGF